MTGLSRRRVLAVGVGAVAAGGLGLAVPALSRPAQTGQLLPSEVVLPPPFQVPLPIPPVLHPGRHPDYPDADYYELTQRAVYQEILPASRTQIWGYNGRFPGPTIVSRSNRRTVVRQVNKLPIPTVTHLHGGVTPAGSDGWPLDLVLPDGTANPHAPISSMPGATDPLARTSSGFRVHDYPLTQRATTLWYHDHRMGFTGPDIWRGLAGFHLIHDAGEDALPLPRGDRDIPLMIVDRSFAADGSLRYPAVDPSATRRPGVTGSYSAGVFGDVILVNGAPWPVLEVAACRYRFRILNASNARRYRLALDPPPPGGGGLVQIGSDGGLLDRPVDHDTIETAPAERFDVVIDFSSYPVGRDVVLANQLGSGRTAHVMHFQVTHTEPDDTAIPPRLSTMERLVPPRAGVVRDFAFQRGARSWTINGHDFDPTRPLVTPRLGTVEVWRIVSDFHHSLHIHLAHFQVLSRNGRAPGPYDAGWKDTVDIRPAEAVVIIARFTGYPGRYVMHCHNLEHEDMAMMATVVVQ
jgi:spore coat protein A, manganese oxidase